MVARFSLFSTVIVLLLLGFFLPRWLGPQNCINSKLVEEITIDTDLGEPLVLSGCSLFSRSFSPAPPEFIQKSMLLSRINKLDELSLLWPKPDHTVSLKVMADKRYPLAFRDDLIEVGRNDLFKLGQIEKALLGYWIGLKDPSTTQVASDLVWSILFDGLDRVKDSKAAGPKVWTENLLTLKGYCGLGKNVLHHEEFCKIQRDLGEGLVVGDTVYDTDEEPVSWSLHGLVSNVLQTVFLKLSLEEKAAFLKKLIFLNHIEADSGFALIGRSSSLAELDQRLWDYVRHMTSSLGIHQEKLWAATKPLLLTENQKPIDYFIVAHNLSWKISDAQNTQRIPIIEKSSAKYLYPSDVPVWMARAKIFQELNLASVTIVGCDTPSPSRLLEFEPYVRRVTFVKMCSGVEFELGQLVLKGSEEYVQADKNVEFVEFNLAPLRLALRTRGQLQSSGQLTDWQKWLHWKGSQFDTNKAAFRPRAALDAINYYRTN